MLKLKLSRHPGNRLVAADCRQFLRVDREEKEAKTVPIPEPKEQHEALKHCLLEALASLIFTYSSIYVPELELDALQQYVPTICIFAVVMTLKDSHYFFPDGTPFATIILWAATLYTDASGRTKWLDMAARIFGQLIGWGAVFLLAVADKGALKKHGMALAYDREGASSHVVIAVNEGIGTLLESVALVFAVIPLVCPYVASAGKNSKGQDHDEEDAGDAGDGIESKAEADPPKIGRLGLVAVSLAAMHYVLDRVFQANMNPLVSVLQLYIRDEMGLWYLPVAGQVCGLVLACVYVMTCKLSAGTLRKLLDERRREHGRGG